MRRRQVLAGLVGITIAGALPGTARAASGEESLEALLLAKAQVPAAPVPLVTLELALEQAQHAFERCEYSELTGAMPRLIATAHASRDAAAGQMRERMSAALARAYLLGSELATKRHRDTVARVAADRSHAAADASDDPLAIAASSRAIGMSMRRDALAAPERIDREAGLTGAITMLTKTALDLGVDHGDPAATVERRARAYVDGARAWNDHGNLDQASSALTAAFRCAPQELQRPSVRDLIATMLDTSGRTPAVLPALAAHAGL